MLPLGVLTDLVRSYTTQAQSVVPQFLTASFEMLREGQNRMLEMSPMAKMPGFEAMKAQQEAFMKAMTGGISPQWSGPDQGEGQSDQKDEEDLDAIKKQLAELQAKLSKMDK